MADPTVPPQEDFAPTREHEYQDAHYHDEDADIANDEIANDEEGRSILKTPAAKKQRVPPPRPRHYED